MMKESYSNNHWLIWIGVTGIVISLLVLLLTHFYYNSTWESSMTLAGTLASLIGICLTLFQTYGVKKTTEAIENAVLETKKDMEKVFSIGDISKNLEIINAIEEDIRQKDYRMALRTMKSLQEQLIEFKEISLFKQFNPRISEVLSKIGSDIDYIQIQIYEGYGFILENAIKNLNKISRLLSEIKATIKHN